MIKKILVSAKTAIFLVLFSFGFFVNATETGGNTFGQAKIDNPLGNITFMGLVEKLLTLLAQVGAVVCVLFLIYSGFLFVKAQGDPGKVTEAKSVFMWTVVGTAVLLGAAVIATLVRGTVSSVLGVSI